ncbi:MAG: ABC transporter ATP-binding protein [Desulfobacterales bacterium]|jgi:ABC-2 type transport system ATP-binding protein
MAPLLEVKNLVKKYESLVAVNGVSFSIEPGLCFGLLGPNGAGKTTTIEVIEDVLSPTSGEIFFKGKPRSTSFREDVGIQFQHTTLLAFLTVRETLETFQSLYANRYDLDALVQLCHLGEFQRQYNDKISGGQRQRFMLALALVNQPELIFLDEPSTGLDPQARRNLWDVIEQIKHKNKTVILTTHYMEEAQHLCDEVAIMDYGRIIAQGAPDELIKKYSSEITVILPKKDADGPWQKLAMNYNELADRLEINTSDLNACLKELLSLGVDLADMTVRGSNLEDVFINLTGRQLRE